MAIINSRFEVIFSVILEGVISALRCWRQLAGRCAAGLGWAVGLSHIEGKPDDTDDRCDDYPFHR